MNKQRLIDATALIERKFIVYDIEDLSHEEFEQLVNEHSTAYNPDKIVEQLQELFYCNEYCQKKFYQGLGCKACLFGKVIEVVKGGGVDE